MIIGDEGPAVGWHYNETIPESQDVQTLVLAFCCVNDDVTFNEIIPAFKKHWKTKTGKDVRFVTGNSEPGFDSVTTTIKGKPVQVGIIATGVEPLTRGFSHTKWRQSANKSVAFRSPTVLLVRKGNPKNIKTFADLAKPGVKIIHANPYAAGGGLWVVYGIYGSALKNTELKMGRQDKDAAYELLKKVEQNTIVAPVTAREAGQLFASGYGDVLITSENKAIKRLKTNKSIEMVIPAPTIMAEWLVYKFEKNVSQEDQALVNEFIDFLFSEQVQEAYAKYAYRPSDPNIVAKYKHFADLKDYFTIDYLGNPTKVKIDIIIKKWEKINSELGGVPKTLKLPPDTPKK